MRSDEGKDTRRDISAEDLLKLLHESVENAPKKSGGTAKPSNGALKIDDDVLDDAKLRISETEDDEADIDALINKYIKRADKRPAPEEPTADTAAELEPERSGEPAAEPIVKPTSESNVESENASEGSTDGKRYASDFAAEDEAHNEPMSELDGEDDVKLYGEAAEPAPALPAVVSGGRTGGITETEDPINDGSTAIFDIKTVREAEGSPDYSSDGDADNATAAQATEVFTPVGEEGELSGKAAEKTYGDPSAEDIDQTDLHLMIAFGMNDELKDTIGEKKASELESELEKGQEQSPGVKRNGKYEYTSRDQNDEILGKYQSSYYGMILRLLLAAVLFGVVFFFENYSLLGMTMPVFLRPEAYPVVYSMVDLQLVVFGFALVYRHLINGFKSLVTLKPTPESLTAFSAVLSVVYTAIACVSAPRQGFTLFNLPIMATVILALIYDFLNLKRDVYSFSVVSTKKKKFVVTPVPDSSGAPERGVFSEFLGDDPSIIRVAKTDFVDGFFGRVGKDGGEASIKPLLGIMMPVILFIAVAFFTVGFIKEQSLYSAMKSAFISVTLTLPLSAYAVYSYPFYRASRQAYDSDSAIIGETSLEEYAGSAVISFEDKEVFPPKGVKVTSIKVYGNNRIDEIIYNLASAFITVGGPLAEVFSQATHDLGHSENVTLDEVEEDGFTVTIDDTQVSIGKASYMERLDFDPPYDAEDKQAETVSAVGIIYVAYQGELAAKVYAQYTIDGEFEKILAQLYRTGMCVGIKSFDPNINDVLLSKKLKSVKYPVKVIRSKTVEDIPHSFEHCESGIVSKRSVKSLLKTVASCEKVSSAVKSAQVVKILAMLLGLVVMVFVSAVDIGFELRSLWTLLYQLIWLVPVMLISRFSV